MNVNEMAEIERSIYIVNELLKITVAQIKLIYAFNMEFGDC
jgi:hypothetical protein